MKFIQKVMTLLITLMVATTFFPVVAQKLDGQNEKVTSSPMRLSAKRTSRKKPPAMRPVIPPVTVLHNPEYLSGEASVNVAANSNPLIRIGIAQNGVTLIEFPAADNFFAIHAGNSDLVTVEKSPSLKRDHHLVLRAGSGFTVPSTRAKGAEAIVPATSIITQMDSGMAITLMVYPVPQLKQQAHRLVINYNRDEVISSRRAAGLATNLGPEIEQGEIPDQSSSKPAADLEAPSSAVGLQTPDPPTRTKPDFKESVEAALKEAVANPKRFKKWSTQRHGLRISTQPPRELSETARVVLFAVKNCGTTPLRLISGYPDLYVETLSENRRPVEAGTKVEKLYLASSATDSLISPGTTQYFALAYETPILGARQQLKIVVAHMTAADEPAMANLTAVSR